MNDASLLAVAFRGRPATIAELATLAQLSIDDVEGAVDRLRSRGRLGGQGGDIVYTNPADWASESVAARAADLRETARDLLGEIERVVTELPAMIGHWSIGQTTAEPMPVVARHGPRASEDLWFEFGRRDVGTLNAVLPDIQRFLTSPAERVARFSEAFRKKDAVRVIIPTAVADDPAMTELLDAFTAAGMEYRFLDDPPSWFWVDGDQIAIPYEWGERRPTSVVSVRSGALAGLVSAYFGALWTSATPATTPTEPWTRLLALMRTGQTLDAASRQMGVNPRTGRRRVAAAMSHYGVSTLFALGAAWAADAAAAR